MKNFNKNISPFINGIKLFTVLIGSVFIFSACSDFLDAEPMTQKTDSNALKTPEDAYTALVGCYDGLQLLYSNTEVPPVVTEILSDNCFGGTGLSNDHVYQKINEFDKSVAPAMTNIYNSFWKNAYIGINRCNTLLSRIDQIDWTGNENLKDIYRGETRLIRAYIYFDLVRMFGYVPLLDRPSDENLPQADPDDVYKLIAEDLRDAIQSLPATPYSNINPSQYGRLTKWGAEALFARVFLYYTGYYGKQDLDGTNKSTILGYLEDVISNGGFGLVDNFSDLWPASSELTHSYIGEDNKETVLSIKYTYTSDYNGNTDGNHWMVMFGMRITNQYPYGQGWGAACVNPAFWNSFDDKDTRKTASIISVADENIEYGTDQADYTGYYIKKYTPMCDENGKSMTDGKGVNFMIGQFQDYVAIRYADVLLMAAELGSTNAQDYFDMVRKRAYQDNFKQTAVSTETIMKERRFELAFEGIYYWDLLRQGIDKAAETIGKQNGTIILNGTIAGTITVNAENVRLTKGLQQIPYQQIDLSKNVLVQNTGW